ncbi:hypothetical protein III71_004574 [Salmonella enterica subsp. enterica serovar Newport]|nr:hypothetical protein [Salmonella enterica subsp. enterica serovar Newport]
MMENMTTIRRSLWGWERLEREAVLIKWEQDALLRGVSLPADDTEEKTKESRNG